MSAYPHNRRAENAGRWLGGAVRRITFRNGRVTRLGHPPIVVRVILWTLGVAMVGLLVLLAFWFALVVVLSWIAFKVLQHGGRQAQFKWEPTDPNDHRQSLFYHPLSYNDDRDPRFPDPRFPDR